MTNPSLLRTADAIAPQVDLRDLRAGFNSMASLTSEGLGSEHAVLVAPADTLNLLTVQPPVSLCLEDFPDYAPQPMAGRIAILMARLDGALGDGGRLLEYDVVDPASGAQKVAAYLEILLRLLLGYLGYLLAQDHALPEEKAIASLGHDALVQLPDGLIFGLGELDELHTVN